MFWLALAFGVVALVMFSIAPWLSNNYVDWPVELGVLSATEVVALAIYFSVSVLLFFTGINLVALLVGIIRR